ncbi:MULTISPECIES: PTS sugar transporter subunit IIB [unclassified Brenneria]|uniref:PTS sugar transporter subunit IIB n=1 Tax=unclassified Brenneria TaxID=2634434 RepID=UPI001553B80A|nr:MULTISPECIES: PTS sugar transporter subunit IIB [unclassified Brenneria]MBJ7222190.1 PTS sugar transporter subunit IIB [Brenneria sp. L3-3C-1]MEE3643433.1 PTS sugar transporter subunit IIB [Brenneria sp. L3_3C_1]MEE3651617.1 PTS sugar transporter subunit IIB [Brenneria sp. HEZEL_4_2_4]NPD01574.1 PTS sugar transporter subunit IIB [Brenneria sp. hezel4-2-4]
MNKILLCCAAGMSTSMLVQRMEKVAREKGIAVEIKAVGFEEFNEAILEYDCCLLGPQIKYKLAEFKVIAAAQNKPIAVINIIDYGMMNGEKVLNDALAMIG